MFAKALIICAVAAVAMAIEYPPGIHPALCPNYPYCNMELLARYTPSFVPVGWELPYARMVPAPVSVVAPTPTKVGAIEYPADVDPASCPNYPYCT